MIVCECQRAILRRLAKHLRSLAKDEQRNDAEFQALGLKQAADIANDWAKLSASEKK